MVYNELMFMNVGRLARRQQYRGKYNDLVTHCSNLDCAQILRTSKQVYHEALPIFYFRYTAHMSCCECFKKYSIAVRSKQLIEHCHDHVKNIAMTHILFDHHEGFIQIREFSTHLITSELQILARYKNTEHISVNLGLGSPYNNDVTFDLARRSHNPTVERAHNYKDVLAENSEYIRGYCAAVATLIKRCDAVVLSNARGPLKDNTFAVHSIRWRPGGTKEIVLYLGCDKYKTSDADIEVLLAKPDREDIGVVRGLE